MATMIETMGRPGRKTGICRRKKHALKTDMTPMVDLGFLLIAFFVVTTELSKPRVADLIMPKEGPPMEVEMSNALTVLIGSSDSVYYYHGEWNEAYNTQKIYKTTLSLRNGLGDVIRQKQQYLDQINFSKEGRAGLMLLIKPGPKADYEKVVNMLDEILINDVKKYALVKPSQYEIEYLP